MPSLSIGGRINGVSVPRESRVARRGILSLSATKMETRRALTVMFEGSDAHWIAYALSFPITVISPSTSPMTAICTISWWTVFRSTYNTYRGKLSQAAMNNLPSIRLTLDFFPTSSGIPFVLSSQLRHFMASAPFFVRLASEHTQDATLAFTFVLNTLTHAPDDGVTSPLAFDLPCLTDGCNIAVVVCDHYDRANLILVRYHPETRSTSSHTLDVPNDLDLYDMNGVCVDDTTGAVHLVDKKGVFSTLRYV
ncbi:hypothetical protein C8R43DRAFT_962848 [Mycena crocata]|nr:hypothetical protein C8R43DRAFT_962848 [Mycena crocata]